MTKTAIQSVLLVLAIMPTIVSTAHGAEPPDANWPQFRGPGVRGVSANPGLPDRWSASENVAWKADIPGQGWSSPIVWGSRVFLTTAVSPASPESPRKGLYLGGERPASASGYEWKVLCLDLDSGKMLWDRTVHQGNPPAAKHLKNSYASETPVTDGQRLYACFGNVGIFCLDLEGRQLWSRPLTPRATRAGWGTAASPTLHRDRLYLVNDNEEKSELLAIDAASGKEVWRVDRDEKSNWSTPFVWDSGLRTEIVTLGSGKVRSYDLDGKLLWWLKGMSSITIATPYADGGLLYISSGYVLDRNRPLYAIRPGATGDISLAAGQTSNAAIAWCNPTAAPYNPTTLLYDGRVYVLLDMGLLSAYNARTGAALYERKRLPEGRYFTASPWAYDGHIYCINEDGVTFVLQAGDEFTLMHTNKLADEETCLATPAIAGDRLLIRTASRLYCIRRSGGAREGGSR
ncbi:MAG: PQQ-binding-like beta-propeller repeat protein [Planctomycetota bacterium]|nr:PQQ-binding-like beta-propeller repeat protein [Planctomycetota bacterium]